jgi:glutaredoxin 3
MVDQNSLIEIYTSRTCGFCHAAKHLLQSRGLKYTEVDITTDNEKRLEIMRLSGQRTVPQIFINGESIGGYQELAELLAGERG